MLYPYLHIHKNYTEQLSTIYINNKQNTSKFEEISYWHILLIDVPNYRYVWLISSLHFYSTRFLRKQDIQVLVYLLII